MRKLLQRFVFAAAAVATSSAMAAVTFYETPNFGGQPLTADGAISDFRAYDFNDRAMSLVVDGAPVEVCEHINFGGNCQVFNPGQYPALGIWSHTISSVRQAYYDRHYPRYGYNQRYYERHGYYPGGHDQRPQWARDHWAHDPHDYYRGGY